MCISVQPKSGKDRNYKNVERYSDAHHKLCFIDENKCYLWVPWPLKQHTCRNLIKLGFFQDVCTFFSGSAIVVFKNVIMVTRSSRQVCVTIKDSFAYFSRFLSHF